MPHEALHYAEEWLRIAEKDFTRVERLLSLDDPEAAGFYLQQAVEKFLKAFLLAQGWKLERIHDLEVLLNAAVVYDRSLEAFREVCQKITGFYLMERYPDVAGGDLTEGDVRQARDQVSGLVKSLKARLVRSENT